jgi:hypothetical protein
MSSPHGRAGAHQTRLTAIDLSRQSRYTTLVWRFLPVAVEPDVRFAIWGLERTAARKFPPELVFGMRERTGRAGAALEDVCTRSFVPVESSIESPQATW